MKKIETRMAAGLAAALLLTAYSVGAQSHPEQEEAPNRPGFFRQLGTSLKNAGGQMVGAKPAQGGAKAAPALGRSTPRSAEAGSCPDCSKVTIISWPSRASLTGPEWH